MGLDWTNDFNKLHKLGQQEQHSLNVALVSLNLFCIYSEYFICGRCTSNLISFIRESI